MKFRQNQMVKFKYVNRNWLVGQIYNPQNNRDGRIAVWHQKYVYWVSIDDIKPLNQEELMLLALSGDI